MGTHYGNRPTRNLPAPSIVGLTVGSANASLPIPSGVQSGDLLVVMVNDPSTSVSGGASSWTTAFTTTGAGFGYNFRCSYGAYSSGSSISIASGYNAMCAAVRNRTSVSSTFGLIANIDSGATSTTSVALNGIMFGMATDRGSSASQPGISGMTFQENKLFGTSFFGCRAVVGLGYLQQTISVTDVSNTFGTQFCMGIIL